MCLQLVSVTPEWSNSWSCRCQWPLIIIIINMLTYWSRRLFLWRQHLMLCCFHCVTGAVCRSLVNHFWEIKIKWETKKLEEMSCSIASLQNHLETRFNMVVVVVLEHFLSTDCYSLNMNFHPTFGWMTNSCQKLEKSVKHWPEASASSHLSDKIDFPHNMCDHSKGSVTSRHGYI